MHILYLVPHVPNPTKARSYFQIRGLLEAGHQVTVATLRRSEADDTKLTALQEMGARILYSPLHRLQSFTNVLMKFPSEAPLQTAFMWSSALMEQINSYVQEYSPDIIHIEHLRMTPYGLQLADQYPIVWDAVDFLTPLFQEASRTSTSLPFRLISRIETPRLAAYEKWLTGQFPQTLVISKYDQSLFQQHNPYASRVLVTMPGLPMTSNTISNVPRLSDTLMITGTLSYHPNVASVQYFVRDIWPLIREHHSGIRLQLVGANPDPSIKALEGNGIEITGYVPSVMDCLSKATISLAPVLYAAGMQNKVLEAFLTATPIVATSVALRGLDVQHEREVLIADTPTDFANAVLRLLTDSDLRARIGEAGRRYVEQNHDLRVTTNHLIEIYSKVIDKKQ